MRLNEERLEHTRYISNNFNYLKGLVEVLLGLFFLIVGFGMWLMNSNESIISSPFIIFVIGLIFFFGGLTYFQNKYIAKVKRYYSDLFGETEDSEEQKRRYFRLNMISSIPIIFTFVHLLISDGRNFTVEAILVSTGLGNWLLSGPRLDARLFGGFLMILGIVLASIPFEHHVYYIYLTLGLVFILQGTLKHFYLRRYLHLGEHHA